MKASFPFPILPKPAQIDKDGFKVPFPPLKGMMSNARLITPAEEKAAIKAQFEKLKCNEILKEEEEK